MNQGFECGWVIWLDLLYFCYLPWNNYALDSSQSTENNETHGTTQCLVLGPDPSLEEPS